MPMMHQFNNNHFVSYAGRNLSVPELMGIFQRLNANPRLISLDLSNTTSCAVFMPLLTQLLQISENLTTLRLNHCQLTGAYVSSLLAAVQGHPALREISLLGNPLDDQAISQLQNAQAAFPNVNIVYSTTLNQDDRAQSVYASPFERF